jgi:membrane-associated phospholipid phosphatase
MTSSDGTDHGVARTSAMRALGLVAARAAAILEYLQGSAAIVRRRPHSPEGSRLLWRCLTLYGFLAVGAVALSMMFLDAPVSRSASTLPTSLVDVFYDITDFGRSGWILFPVGGLIILIALGATPSLDRISRAVLAIVAVRLHYVFVAVGLPGLVNTIVKRWIGRERPSLHGPFVYEPFSWQPEFASFPSGHATTAFAALVAIGGLYPRTRPLLWAYALLIGVSRVAVLAHYPSDVIAGAVTGAFGALCVRQWFASRRLGFYFGSDGVVYPKPGASRQRTAKVARALMAA